MDAEVLDPIPLRALETGHLVTDGAPRSRERTFGCADLPTAFAAATALCRLGLTAEADIGVAGWPAAVRVWVELGTADVDVVRRFAESVWPQMQRVPNLRSARVSVQVLAARSARRSTSSSP